MEYNDKGKLFTGELDDTTANRCIIHGCIEGVRNLKEACIVEFVTAIKLSVSKFKKGKGVNKDLLLALTKLLNEKGCEFNFTVEEGKGDWLKEKIHGF